jgi:cephalosporin-C deacetylase
MKQAPAHSEDDPFVVLPPVWPRGGVLADSVFTAHPYDFDPTHGYDLEGLLQVAPPETPAGFEEFWQTRFGRALTVTPNLTLWDGGEDQGGWRVWKMTYSSTDEIEIGGWLLLPLHGVVRRAVVVSHAYCHREEPDFTFPLQDAAVLFPCSRGLGKSRDSRLPNTPAEHVRHNIDNRDKYVLGGCVDDIWLGVSALLRLFPQVAGHIGYIGGSFGGGIGALACAWDHRITRAHLIVPTFGNHPLRAKLSSGGSASALQDHLAAHPQAAETLQYYDAAVAAKFVRIPTLCACALFDPVVAPAGQFAIYNALAGEKSLFVFQGGHMAYADQAGEERSLKTQVQRFFLAC